MAVTDASEQALDAVQSALDCLRRVIDGHGDVEVGGPAAGPDGDDEPYYSLEIAAGYLRDAELALEREACGCRAGVLWPCETDGNADHGWVERCDECARFDGDVEAAEWLARDLLGRSGSDVVYGMGWIGSLERFAPFIDVTERRQ